MVRYSDTCTYPCLSVARAEGGPTFRLMLSFNISHITKDRKTNRYILNYSDSCWKFENGKWKKFSLGSKS